MTAEELKELFKKPTIVREDPRVNSLNIEDIESIAKETNIETDEKKLEIFNEKIRKLAEGFDSIIIEYDKLLEVLSKRADMRSLIFDMEAAALKSPSLSSASHLIYGSPKKAFKFSDYINLLKYEQSIAAEHTARLVTDQPKELNQTLESLQMVSSPEISAVSVIKDSYKKFLIDNQAEDLLIAELFQNFQITAASDKSSLYNASEKLDNSNQLDGRSGNKAEAKVKVSDIVKDCLPCLEREINTVLNFPKHRLWQDFIDLSLKSYLSALLQLAKYKLVLSGYSFTRSICSIIDILMNTVCLPDLASLISAIKMMLAHTKDLYMKNFTIGGPRFFSDFAMLLLTPVMDAALSTLMRVLSAILSPIDCVLRSFNHELNKILPALNEAGITNNAYADDSGSGALRKLLRDTAGYKFYIENMIRGFINEKTENWEVKVFKGDETIDLYENISLYTRSLTMFVECYSIAGKYTKYMAALITGKEKENLYKSICMQSFRNEPWIKFLTVGSSSSPFQRDDKSKDDNNSSKLGEKGNVSPDYLDIEGNLSDVEKQMLKDLTLTSKDGYIMIDTSLPDDFFDDFDIASVLDDPYFKKLFDSLDYSGTIENGKDAFSLDLGFIKKFKTEKENRKTLKKIMPLITPATQNNSGFIPASVIGFSGCINANSLSGYSQEELQEWINRAKS